MRRRRASRTRAVGLALLLVCAATATLALLEYRNGGVIGYQVPGLPVARSPSLWLDLKEILGLQEFHSQLGQDKWIIGQVFPGVTDGYFVDVGAWDAVVTSNSKALEALGWTGICIEPFPRNWKNRSCQLFREVVYSHKGEVVEFRMSGILGGIDEQIETYREQVAADPVVELTTTTIGEVLDRAGAPSFIHYVSLDTEGSELEILKAFPFERYSVGAFSIEHNFEEPKRRRIARLLSRHGYRIARVQVVEDWYVRADLAPRADPSATSP